jgi:hypothetical protein
MSILDDENIVVEGIKRDINNPFLTLSEYLSEYLKDFNGFMDVDQALVERILCQLNLPTLYEYKFKFEFERDRIDLIVLNSNDKFVCTILSITQYYHRADKNIYLYFSIFTEFGKRIQGEENIIINDFLNNILKKYNFGFRNTLMFKQ